MCEFCEDMKQRRGEYDDLPKPVNANPRHCRATIASNETWGDEYQCELPPDHKGKRHQAMIGSEPGGGEKLLKWGRKL
jgi:hypothetical protein